MNYLDSFLLADSSQICNFFLASVSTDWSATPGAPVLAYAPIGDFSGSIDTFSAGSVNSVLFVDGVVGEDITGGDNSNNYFCVRGGNIRTLTGSAKKLDRFLVTGGAIGELWLNGSGDTAVVSGGSVGSIAVVGNLLATLTVTGDAQVRDIKWTGGTLTITGNAVVHDITITSGSVYFGGFDATAGIATVTGDIRIKGGVSISVNSNKADLSGATIHIDFAGLSGSVREFTTDAQFTTMNAGELSISVSSDQAVGTYGLVSGASSLQGIHFTLRIDGVVFGVLGDGNEIVYNNRRYSLEINTSAGSRLRLVVAAVTADVSPVIWPDAAEAPRDAKTLGYATGSIENGDYQVFGADGKVVYSAVAAGGSFENFTGSDNGPASYFHLTDSEVSGFNGKRISLLLAGESAISGSNNLRELYLYDNSSLAGDLRIAAGGALFVDGAGHAFGPGTSITFDLGGMTETERALIGGSGALALLGDSGCDIAVSLGSGQTLGRFLLAENAGSSYGTFRLQGVGGGGLGVNQNYEAQEVRYSLATDSAGDLYFHVFNMHRVIWHSENESQGAAAALELHDGFSGSIQSKAYLVADKHSSAAPSYSVYFAAGSAYGDVLGGVDRSNAFYVAGGTVDSITGGGTSDFYRIAGGSVGTIDFGGSRHSRLFVDGGASIDRVIGGAAASQTIEIRGSVGSMTGIIASDPVISVWDNGSIGYFEGTRLSLYGSATLGSADISVQLGLYNSSQAAPITITGTVNLHGANSKVVVNTSFANISNAVFNVDLTGINSRNTVAFDNYFFSFSPGELMVTVSADQALGAYRLAGYTGVFARSFTLRVGGADLGGLSLNETRIYDGRQYTLVQNDSTVSLQVSAIDEGSLYSAVDWRGLGGTPSDARNSWSVVDDAVNIVSNGSGNQVYSVVATGSDRGSIEVTDDTLDAYMHLTGSTVQEVKGSNLSLLLDGNSSGTGGELRVRHLCMYGTSSIDYFAGAFVSGVLLLGGTNTVNGQVVIDGAEGVLALSGTGHTVSATITVDFAGSTGRDYAVVLAMNGARFTDIAPNLTVNVSSTQESGLYLLTEYIAAFSGTINFTIDGLSRPALETGAAAQQYGLKLFSLVQENDKLYIKVESNLATRAVDWRGQGINPATGKDLAPFSGQPDSDQPLMVSGFDYLFGAYHSAAASGGTFFNIAAADGLESYLHLTDSTVNGVTGGDLSLMLDGGATLSAFATVKNLYFYGTARTEIGAALTVTGKLLLGGSNTLEGTVTISSGGYLEVTADLATLTVNSAITFDLAGATPDGGALVRGENGAAFASGKTFTVTVSETQAAGSYLICSGVAVNHVVEIKIGDQTLQTGADYRDFGDRRYALRIQGSDLALQVLAIVNVDWSAVGVGVVTRAIQLGDGFSGALDPKLHLLNGALSVCLDAGNSYGDLSAFGAMSGNFTVKGGDVNSITAADGWFRVMQTGGHIGSINGNMNAAMPSQIFIVGGTVDSISGFSDKASITLRGGSLGYFSGKGSLTVWAGSRLGGADVYNSITLIGKTGPADTVISGVINLHDNALFSVSDYSSGVYQATVNIDLTGAKRTVGVCLASQVAAVANWTITVDGNMEAGEYQILRTAATFTGSLTVRTAAGAVLGVLGMENVLWDGDRSFRFVLDSFSNLVLSISDDFRQTGWGGEGGGPSTATALGDAFSGAIADAANIVTDAKGNFVYSVCADAGATYGDLVYGGELDNYLLINGGTIDGITGGDILNGELFIRMEGGTVLGNINAGYTRTDDGRAVAHVEINGGSVAGSIIGSNRNGNGAAVDEVEISVGEAGINNIYGGGVFVPAAVAGFAATSSTIEISKVDIVLDGYSSLNANSYIFGGATANGAGVSVSVGAVSIRIEDAASGGNFHGGGYGAAGGVSHVETVTISIADGNHSGYFYCGGRADGGGVSTTGSVSLSVTGGIFSGYLFGGGYSKNGDSIVTGDVNISISGGTFGGTVYGGAQKASNSTGTALVAGDITITVDVSGNNIVSFRSGSGITLGGNAASQVSGDTRLVLTGDAANFRTGDGAFTGWLNAGGGTDAGKTHTLAFHDFTAEALMAQYRSFNHLEFSGDTSVTIGTEVNWEAGMDYTFRLAGRAADAETAILKQESGSLGMTGASVFLIDLDGVDFSAGSGHFLLIDGIDGLASPFDGMKVCLNYNGDTLDGEFNGASLSFDDNLAFSLVYEQNTGSFTLDWARTDGLEDPDALSLFRGNGMLA